MDPEGLQIGLQGLQDIARSQVIEGIQADQQARKDKKDVTARWLGFNPDGTGRVEYLGQIFNAEVLASTCKQKYAKVSLRRTPTGNFVNWQ